MSMPSIQAKIVRAHFGSIVRPRPLVVNLRGQPCHLLGIRRKVRTWKIGIWKSDIYLFGSLRSRGPVMPKTIFTGANQVVVSTLRQAREAAGLTQAEVGRRLGKDQSHISLIEASQRRLDLVEFHDLAQAIGRDPVEMFAEIAAKFPRPA